MTSKIVNQFFFIGITVLILNSSSCKEETGTQQPAALINGPVSVKVFTVTEDSTRSQIDIMGTIESTEKAIIASRINGHITVLNASLGSRVKTGDELITISAEEIYAKLLQSSAQLNQAERNLKREQKLLSKNATSTESVKSQEDAFKIAQASHKEAQSMLSYTAIRAPFDGIITKKLVNIGDLATPGKPLLHLENEKQLQVLTDIPEAMVLKMKIGDEIEATIPAAKITVEGTITEIAPSTDPLTRTTTVKIAIPSAENIRSGQFARVHLTQSQVTTIFIPKQAVSRYGQMERVFLLDQNVARLSLVRTGKESGERVEIISGLSQDDTIIIPVSSQLRDGQKVQISN
jgi:membrane fusion protein, multidrug efflux system